MKGRSPTLAWPSASSVVSKLDTSIWNIASTATSYHPSAAAQFGDSPSFSRPTIESPEHLQKANVPSHGCHAVKKSPQLSSRLSPTGSPSRLSCPFCSEVGIEKLIKRKYDLIRHFKKFHKNSELWRCPESECGIIFDWKKPFETHVEKTHPNAKNASRVSMMTPLPQLVFACGFSNCKAVFEVGEGGDAEEIANEFFEHVANKIVKHSGDKLPALDWKYSVRFRNLMRQGSVDRYWKERVKGHPELAWQPHNSFILRKLFETRRCSSTPLLVQWAITLGSPPFCNPESLIPKPPLGLDVRIEDGISSKSSDYGSQCPSDMQPGGRIDRPAPPATGPMDLGEPFLQLPPASPQYDAVPRDPVTPAPQPFTFDSTYHSFEEADLFQSQRYPEHGHVYHGFPHVLPTSLPIQQQTSQYPPSPLNINIPTPGYPGFLVTDPQLITPVNHPSIPFISSGEMEMQDAPQRGYGDYA